MTTKITLAFCATALFVQTVFSQYAAGIGGPYGLNGCNGLAGAGLAGAGLAAPGLIGPGLSAPALGGGYGAGYGCGGVASTGGGFLVTSVSPIAPTGVTVVSENAFEGSLSANGNLPFLSTVVLEGVLPTTGAGAISYGCGNSAVGIAAEEGPIATGIIGAGTYPAGLAAGTNGIAGYGPAGIGNGLAGIGYGAAGIGNGVAGIGYGAAGIGYGAGVGYGAAGIGTNGLGCGCGGLA